MQFESTETSEGSGRRGLVMSLLTLTLAGGAEIAR
jgi:hypothetical protein